jgi:GH35 family endo-1,4-beta-xylanase
VLLMVRALRAQGVRRDGIGIQGHVNWVWPTQDALRRRLKAFAARTCASNSVNSMCRSIVGMTSRTNDSSQKFRSIAPSTLVLLLATSSSFKCARNTQVKSRALLFGVSVMITAGLMDGQLGVSTTRSC